MDRTKLNELYEKLYFHELEARDQLSNRCQIPLLVLLALAGSYSLVFKSLFTPLEFPCIWAYYAYIGLCIASIIMMIVSSVFWAKSLSGSAYHCIPSASETESYREALVDYHSSVNPNSVDENVEKQMSEYVYSRYAQCSSYNTAVNDRRSRKLYFCNRYLLCTSVLIVLCLIGHFFIESRVEKVTNVKFTEGSKSTLNIDTQTINLDFSEDIKRYLNESRDGERSK
ncbi:hypothetical protein [Marinomonas fungiae]|uniref:hypothetical protein n=1 Tax=Marinomonas fungiae TaxID=1137284 RepID=UPI003A919153